MCIQFRSPVNPLIFKQQKIFMQAVITQQNPCLNIIATRVNTQAVTEGFSAAGINSWEKAKFHSEVVQVISATLLSIFQGRAAAIRKTCN